MGGVADFKVGYKTGFASGASEKKIVPPLFQIWGTSKQISVGAYWIIEICCLVVTLINIGRPRPMVLWIRDRDSLVMATLVSWVCCRSKDHCHWTAPCTPCTPLVPKVGDIVPTPPGCATHGCVEECPLPTGGGGWAPSAEKKILALNVVSFGAF